MRIDIGYDPAAVHTDAAINMKYERYLCKFIATEGMEADE